MRRQVLQVTLLRSSVALPGKEELYCEDTCTVFPHKTDDAISWTSSRALFTKCIASLMKTLILAFSNSFAWSGMCHFSALISYPRVLLSRRNRSPILTVIGVSGRHL